MQTIIEILIDNSNSMGRWKADEGDKSCLLPDGSTRMELAKMILIEEIIPQLDYANKIFIRLFHSAEYTDNTTKTVIPLVYGGPFNKLIILSKVSNIAIPENTGGTPITAAVNTAIASLLKYAEPNKQIFLITDGQETDGGDYKKSAEEGLKKFGIPCSITIIGIAQDSEAEEKSKELAMYTKGGYINLREKLYSKTTLQNELRPIFINSLKTSLQNIALANIPGDSTSLSKPSSITHQVIANGEESIKNEVSVTESKNETTINLISKQLIQLTEAISNLQIERRTEENLIEIEENPELNERVRLASESFLYAKLKEKFGTRIKWLNETNESYQDHDFEVIDPFDDSKEYFIECKASMYADKVFLMTKKEWLFFLENKNNYQVYFISNALKNPQIYKIDNLMESLILGKVLPFANKNFLLKAERILFTITD